LLPLIILASREKQISGWLPGELFGVLFSMKLLPFWLMRKVVLKEGEASILWFRQVLSK
jgi:hypothetical protein